jgi:hypothetical protein
VVEEWNKTTLCKRSRTISLTRLRGQGQNVRRPIPH